MQTRIDQGGSGKEIPVRLKQTLRTLLKIGRAIVEAADEHQLLQSVCDIFVEDGGFRSAWVGYPELDPPKIIRPFAQAGDQDGILRNLNLTWDKGNFENPASVSIRTGQTCFNKDNQILSLPLKSDGQAFGALTLYATDPGQFEQDTVELLEEWSDLFANALIVARQAALRADIATAFSREDSVHGILHQCAEALVHHLDAAFARIWTLNKDKRVLQLQASAGLYTHLDGAHSSIPIGKLKIGWIAQEKMPHLTNDVIHDPRISDREWAEREGLVAFAGYPLLVEGRVIGVMAMFSRKPLSASTLEILASIADPIAQGVERKRAEEELLAKQELVDLAQKAAHAVAFDWHIQKEVNTWSPEQEALYGLPRGSFDGSYSSWKKLVHPDDRPQFVRAIEHPQPTGDLSIEFRVVWPDESIHWLAANGQMSLDGGGKPNRIVGFTADITPRKLVENELRRSEAYLREAQRLSLTGSFGWNVSSGKLYWSDETYRIVGLDPLTKPTVEEVLRRVHPDDVVIVQQSLERAIRDSTDLDFEHRFLMPDGSIKHVHVVAHALKDEKGIHEYVGAVTDVTVTKLAEEKKRQDEREIRQIVEAIPQLIMVLAPDRRFLYANEAVLEYTGYTQEEIVAEDMRQRVIHPEDLEWLREKSRQAMSHGIPFEAEYRALRKDGQYRWFLTRLNPLRDEQGHIIRWYATAIDIHDRKEAEEKVRKENIALREEIDKTSMFEEIVGVSSALQTVLSRVSKVAPTDSTVLIHGETGTGKELIARAIHKRSERSSRAFVSVNCAAIPSSLIASELFGHEKGSFTGAIQRRLGRFELADGGTIFLDEIGELPAEIQITLLRVLQERVFERVGGNQSIRADARVIAATNRDLQAAIDASTFRIDLFYRLNVVPLEMPPLRERREDIPLLMEYFIDRYASKAGKKIRSVNKKTLELFQSYSWPGNIRELQNVIERSLIFCDTETFSVDESWLSLEFISTPPASQQLYIPQPKGRIPEEKVLTTELDDILDAPQIENLERQNIVKALNRCDWRISGKNGAAKLLGIPPTTLSSRMKALKIKRPN
jgi:PAS domain S-box-containing protein